MHQNTSYGIIFTYLTKSFFMFIHILCTQ